MKEMIMEAFAELGFKLKPAGEIAFDFWYENIYMLWIFYEDDYEYLSICIPNVYKTGNEEPSVINELINQINSSVKYVKAYNVRIEEDSVWLFYERELLMSEEMNLQSIIANMILRLETASIYAHKVLAEIKKENMYNTSVELLDDNDANE